MFLQILQYYTKKCDESSTYFLLKHSVLENIIRVFVQFSQFFNLKKFDKSQIYEYNTPRPEENNVHDLFCMYKLFDNSALS